MWHSKPCISVNVKIGTRAEINSIFVIVWMPEIKTWIILKIFLALVLLKAGYGNTPLMSTQKSASDVSEAKPVPDEPTRWTVASGYFLCTASNFSDSQTLSHTLMRFPEKVVPKHRCLPVGDKPRLLPTSPGTLDVCVCSRCVQGGEGGHWFLGLWSANSVHSRAYKSCVWRVFRNRFTDLNVWLLLCLLFSLDEGFLKPRGYSNYNVTLLTPCKIKNPPPAFTSTPQIHHPFPLTPSP